MVKQSDIRWRRLDGCFSHSDEIDDTALLSGLCEFETLDRVIAEMLRAERDYTAFGAANAPSPA